MLSIRPSCFAAHPLSGSCVQYASSLSSRAKLEQPYRVARVYALLLHRSAQLSLGGHAVLHFASRSTLGCHAQHSMVDVPPLPLLCSAGHSLGGALAVLAAWDLAPLFPGASLKVYTVGAPRPGNHAFAKVTAHLSGHPALACHLGAVPVQGSPGVNTCCVSALSRACTGQWLLWTAAADRQTLAEGLQAAI